MELAQTPLNRQLKFSLLNQCMGKLAKKKRQYQLLHRYMSGLTVSCIVVIIIGGWAGGVGSEEVLWRAALVAAGLFVAQYVIIKFWASWQFAQVTPGKKRSSKRKK